jgi:hypothetical protein
MGVNPVLNNYSLPKVGTEFGIGVMSQLLTKRSLSVTMGYEGHRDIFTNPSSYVLTNRMDHIYDGVIMPSRMFPS